MLFFFYGLSFRSSINFLFFLSTPRGMDKYLLKIPDDAFTVPRDVSLFCLLLLYGMLQVSTQ